MDEINDAEWVQVKEINDMLGLPYECAYGLMQKGVFTATKLRKSVWAVPESEVAYVVDRILRYRARQPWYPLENYTIEEAIAILGVTASALYGMGSRRAIDWAENEHWKFPTKLSVNRMAHRKGKRIAS